MNLKNNYYMSLYNNKINKDVINIIMDFIGDEDEIIKSYKNYNELIISDKLNNLQDNLILYIDLINKSSKVLHKNLIKYLSSLRYFIYFANPYSFNYKKEEYKIIKPNEKFYIKKNHNKDCYYNKKKCKSYCQIDYNNISKIIIDINKNILDYQNLLLSSKDYIRFHTSISIKNKLNKIEDKILINSFDINIINNKCNCKI